MGHSRFGALSWGEAVRGIRTACSAMAIGPLPLTFKVEGDANEADCTRRTCPTLARQPAMGVAPDAARPLVRLALAERYRDGWRLTPSGLQHYKPLPKSPLQNGSPSLVIDNILNRAIPMARSRSILQPEMKGPETLQRRVRSVPIAHYSTTPAAGNPGLPSMP